MLTLKEVKAAIAKVHDKHENGDAKAHAVFGASTSERWVACPASVPLSLKAGKKQAGDAALEGSLGHVCLEMFLTYHETPVETRKVLRKVFPEEMVQHAFKAFEHLVSVTPKGAERFAEMKVDSSHFTKAEQFGTVDSTIAEEFGVLRVSDYKYGHTPVEAKGNHQMIYYALAVAKRYDYNFATVIIEIIQPRAQHVDGPIRSAEMSMTELLKWEKVFRLAVKQAEGKNPVYRAGPHCKYCDGKALCTEIGKTQVRAAELDFDVIPDDPKKAVKEVVAGLDSKRLAKLLAAFPYVEMYIEAVKDHAKDLLRKGEKVAGYKLVDNYPTRSWKDAAAVEREAKKTWGPLAFAPAELLTPPAMEKVLGIEFDEKKIEEWIEKRVEKKSVGTSMVKDSDKREPTNSAQKDFTVIGTETKKGKKK